MRFLSVIIIFIITFSIKAQQVKVLELESNFPIENVIIYNDSNNTVVYTNKKGISDLSSFKDSDIISFNHIGYYEYEILKRELKVIDFVVYLSKSAEQLDEIVLSASKGEENRSRIAEQIVVTSRDEIKKMAPQTSADLLANLPGVRVQKTQSGGGSPVLRGMEANKVLLVVDGVRMNNAIYRTGHLQNAITVSPNIIERVEVIFGPSSVIYGSDALGGVIHYYTKTPKISKKNEINSAIYSRFSSSNNEITTEGNVEFRQKNWASYTSISQSKFGELKMGKTRNHGYEDWGKVFEYSNNTNSFYNPNSVINKKVFIQKNTNYTQTDVLQKIAIPLSDQTGLTLNFQYSTSSNINNYSDLTEYSGNKLKYAESYYGPQKRLLISSQFKINPDLKWLQNGDITAAFQSIEESRIQRKLSSLDRSYRIENLDIFSLNGDFFVSLTKGTNRILSYGFEASHNKVNSEAYGKTLVINGNSIIGFADDFVVQSRYPDGGSSYTNVASYLNYRQDISKKATLNTGVRFTKTHLTAKWIDNTFITLPDMDISLDNSALTATFGVAYKPSINWQLNSVISSGFRSPNTDDVGKIREKSGNVTVPNIYLKPEYVYNFETSILKYFKNKTFQTSLNVYYTLLTNYIARDNFNIGNSSTILYDGDVGNVMANVNKKNAFIAGGTFGLRGSFVTNWFTKGSITYTKGKTLDTKEPLPSIPPLFGSFEIGFEKDFFKVNLNLKYAAAKKLNNYSTTGEDNLEQTPINNFLNSYYGTPSWNTINLNTNCRINNRITVYATIDNIFDINYREFASSISASGRNFSLSFLLSI